MTDDVRDVNTETTDATEVAEIDSAAGEAGDSATEAFDTDSATESTAQKGQRHRDLWRMQVTLKPVPVILILLMLISGGATGWLYLEQYRPDQQTDSGAARAAVAAASDGTIALLSYSPDTLDQDFATARSHLAGDFLSYYDQFTQQIVAPAAKQKSLKPPPRWCARPCRSYIRIRPSFWFLSTRALPVRTAPIRRWRPAA